jgi:hypothetical protein
MGFTPLKALTEKFYNEPTPKGMKRIVGKFRGKFIEL